SNDKNANKSFGANNKLAHVTISHDIELTNKCLLFNNFIEPIFIFIIAYPQCQIFEPTKIKQNICHKK
ncbi:hypothetical protein, partial [Shewanella sp. SG41-4]|uniref:hypothetical protein n=1 Tax=Shewanella sp. SG41-4 TaxID=2760976 RepID=UPI001C723334